MLISFRSLLMKKEVGVGTNNGSSTNTVNGTAEPTVQSIEQL
jgi:hypothetical protein